MRTSLYHGSEVYLIWQSQANTKSGDYSHLHLASPIVPVRAPTPILGHPSFHFHPPYLSLWKSVTQQTLSKLRPCQALEEIPRVQGKNTTWPCSGSRSQSGTRGINVAAVPVVPVSSCCWFRPKEILICGDYKGRSFFFPPLRLVLGPFAFYPSSNPMLDPWTRILPGSRVPQMLGWYSNSSGTEKRGGPWPPNTYFLIDSFLLEVIERMWLSFNPWAGPGQLEVTLTHLQKNSASQHVR